MSYTLCLIINEDKSYLVGDLRDSSNKNLALKTLFCLDRSMNDHFHHIYSNSTF